MKLTIRKEAEQDIEAAVIWYESQRDGLGGELLIELDRLFSRITHNPRLFPEIGDGIRRALTRRFPYAAYSQLTTSKVTVYAVLHQHRNPAPWSHH